MNLFNLKPFQCTSVLTKECTATMPTIHFRQSKSNSMAVVDTMRLFKALGFIVIASMSVVACGGGGGSSTIAPPSMQDDGADQDNDSTDNDVTGDDGGAMDDDSADEGTTDNTDNSGNGTGSEPPLDTGDTGTGSTGNDDVTDSVAQRGEPFVLLAENEAAPDGDGEVLSIFNNNSLAVNRDGSFAVTGTYSLFSPGNILWGGSIFNPKIVLKEGDALPGFPDNVRLGSIVTPTLSPEGEIATLVTLSGASEGQAVVRVKDSVFSVIARSDEPASFGTKRYNLVDMRNIEYVGERVGFVSGRGSNRYLWVHSGEQLKGIVTNDLGDALLQPDGCRILFTGSTSSTPRFGLSADGSVIFEGTVTIENGADGNPVICPHRNKVIQTATNTRESLVGKGFRSIVRYNSSGVFERIVSRGDDVPGMNETFFRNVSLRQVLPDNTMVVEATLGNLSMRDNESVASLWLFKPDGSSQLILIEGEQFDSSTGAANFVLDDIRGSIQLSPNGSVAALFTDNIFRNDATSWLLAGQAHLSQPHATVDSIGSGSLSPIAFQGGPSPEGFADSTFFGPIANVVALNNGSGYFTGAILDVDDSVLSIDAIWKYDANGDISPVLTDRQGVVIDGLPNLFSNLPNQNTRTPIFPIGNDAIVFIESSNGVRSKIIYLPVER